VMSLPSYCRRIPSSLSPCFGEPLTRELAKESLASSREYRRFQSRGSSGKPGPKGSQCG
jgi:hypothetical protein